METSKNSGQPVGGTLQNVVRCLVVGVTERDGEAWDLVCVADGLGRITVDPFVGCALPELSDSERRALIGQSFDIGIFWKHSDGVYLCHVFTPNPQVSGPTPGEHHEEN